MNLYPVLTAKVKLRPFSFFQRWKKNWVPAVAGMTMLVSACASGAPTGGGDDWITPGGDIGKSHHSSLTDISLGNVARLGLAWQVTLDTNRGLEATPVVIDGIMYTSGNLGRVYAFNAATGKELWRFEPEVDMQANRSACCDQVNRGVAVKDGRVFVGALDGMVYALDAKSGAVLWKADSVDDHSRGVNITGAPEIAGNVVVIGNGGAEYDVRGYVTAFDTATGKIAWRFYTVPSDPKKGPQASPDLDKAFKTWDPNSRWDIGGGGTVWDAINYDPELDSVYIGVGNGGPYHVKRRSPAGGDNLYLSSIVALDPKTGRMKWHYQETPGDSWDYTATQPMILTHLEVDGQKRPVVLHAPKNGFLYVIDRRDGKLLRAHSLVHQNWANGVDLKTGRPRLTPEKADYSNGPKIVFPGSPGARNWQPGAYNPQTGLFYASILDMGNLLFMGHRPMPFKARALNNDAALIFTPDLIAALPTLPPSIKAAVEASPELERVKKTPAIHELRAIDPLTGKTAWAQPSSSWQDRGGVLSTAGGLVFQGSITGDFNVYDARTGKLLKSVKTGASIMAAPMTYKVDGVQYIAVMAGWGGGGWPYVARNSAAYKYGNQGRILVFKLDGGSVPLPEELPPLEVAPEPPVQAPGVTPAMIGQGRGLFLSNCAICHSNQYRSISPDLTRMQTGTHEAFKQIVLGGLLLPNGMPRWDDILSDSDADAIHAYLIDEQKKKRTRDMALKAQGKPLDTPSLAILSSY
ncbi:PQQ-dependent dehydrogenase, methanol/ethanol family [Rhizorhapis suberifaciens]|uniref:Quinohemoprotein ethanol dehydrogenase n=1 Tax=Rhizorhapis suberifaciens TaxID=13656 RepID=A0A840HSW0_9SPHN|nr:PQQ-dependent dehydrogenase, methanol/ethanol family [Rhizorhapis suberifaciens]MBB4640596.1 quinohemoprotein ethanol dehydrogenase [Rhizorhapis suberifaciens]